MGRRARVARTPPARGPGRSRGRRPRREHGLHPLRGRRRRRQEAHVGDALLERPVGDKAMQMHVQALWRGLDGAREQAIGYVECLALTGCRSILLTQGARFISTDGRHRSARHEASSRPPAGRDRLGRQPVRGALRARHRLPAGGRWQSSPLTQLFAGSNSSRNRASSPFARRSRPVYVMISMP